MKNARKIVIFILLGVLFVQNSFFAIVFAADTEETDTVACKTCTMASYEFQTYINFQVDMMQVLRKATRVEEESSDNKKVGLFGAGILKLPANMIKAWTAAFKKGTKKLADGLKATKMGSIMLTAITTEIAGKDAGGGLLILFRNEPFVREWTTLQDLDASLHDAMWDLGMEGIWGDGISSDLMKDIESLQQKYKENAGNELGLFSTFKTQGSVKYKDMVYMLLRLNGMMKTFVSMDHSSPVNSKVITRGGLSLAFNKALMDKMVVSYACASKFSPCSSMWKDFADNTKVRKQISEGFEESMITINKANSDLWEAMLGFGSSVKDTFSDKEVAEEIGLTTKQLSILRSAYGIDTTKLSKEQGIGLEKTIFAITHPGQIINSINLKPLDYFSAEDKKAREENAKMRAQAKQDAKYLAVLSRDNTKSVESLLLEQSECEERGRPRDMKTLKCDETTVINREKEMRAGLKATLDSVLIQKQEDKQLFMIYSNLAVTKYFVEIGSSIHDIIETSIGTKDSKGLIKNLGDACVSQCTNKGITNCFAK